MSAALDLLLVAAKRRGLEVKWRRGSVTGGFWWVWCDDAPLCSDWTPGDLLTRLLQRAVP